MHVAETVDPALARLAHELRTPLGAIVSLAEVMRDEQLGAMGNPRYKAYAGDIHDTARHTLDLVVAMLDGAVASASDTAAPGRIAGEPVDLNAICSSSASAMRPIAARGGVTLETRLDPALPMVRADRRSLRQIILNVVSNGLRHTAAGGRIEIATRREPGGEIILSIADSGSGMRAADIDRALGKAPAAQVVSRRLRVAGSQSGTGIGLPLVRELTEAHGGRLEIESHPGTGTRIVIRLPADRAL